MLLSILFILMFGSLAGADPIFVRNTNDLQGTKQAAEPLELVSLKLPDDDDDLFETVNIRFLESTKHGNNFRRSMLQKASGPPRMDTNLKHQVLQWAMQKEKQNQEAANIQVGKNARAADSAVAKIWAIQFPMHSAPVEEFRKAQLGMSIAWKAKKQHIIDLNDAKKNMAQSGINLETVGMINSNMRQRMLKAFAPLPNPHKPSSNDDFRREGLARIATRPKTEEMHRSSRVIENVKKVGAGAKKAAAAVTKTGLNVCPHAGGGKAASAMRGATCGLRKAAGSLLKGSFRDRRVSSRKGFGSPPKASDQKAPKGLRVERARGYSGREAFAF